MSPRSRRVVVILLLLLLALIALFLVRCSREQPAAQKIPVTVETPKPVPSASVGRDIQPDEILTPATVQVPARVLAGQSFRAAWKGPDNAGDYLTIVRPGSSAATYENYRETRHGPSIDLTAPIEPGEWEVRYITARSKTVLAKAALIVTPADAVITAQDEVLLGAPVSIAWTGPDNTGDFIAIVAKGAPDSQVGNYGETIKGSPLIVNAPVEAGEAEIRYITGQGRKVLGRRTLKVAAPETSVAAPSSVVAGAKFSVTWKGPANSGDYITVVPKGTPDGQYRNYSDVAKGPVVELTAPIEAGDAEIRYMTGSGARVLARRPLAVTAATVTLEAAEKTVAGAPVKVVWTGPNHVNDYITIVPKTTPDGQYANYLNTTKGSPLSVTAPIRAGEAEIRYMSGQGAKVLARRGIIVVPATISMKIPAESTAGASVSMEWEGPNNPGDYFTVVPRAAKDGTALRMVYTSQGSPVKLAMPKEPGPFDVRYMSGQGNLVLARSVIEVR